MTATLHIWLQMANKTGRFIKGYTYKDGKFGLILTSDVSEGFRLDTPEGNMTTWTTVLINHLLDQSGDNDAIPEAQMATVRRTIQNSTKLAMQMSFK